MKAVLLLGGRQPGAEELERRLACADLVVTADGGAHALHRLGQLPHVLVGDMDSIVPGLDRELEAAGVTVLRSSPQKDETDGQLALDYALERGATELVLLGAGGGRLDHLLGNLQLLLRAARRGARAVLSDGGTSAWAATGRADIAGRAQDTISLVPVGDGVAVTYGCGFKYGTGQRLELAADQPLGISNELTEDKATVTIEGWALIVKIDSSSLRSSE